MQLIYDIKEGAITSPPSSVVLLPFIIWVQLRSSVSLCFIISSVSALGALVRILLIITIISWFCSHFATSFFFMTRRVRHE